MVEATVLRILGALAATAGVTACGSSGGASVASSAEACTIGMQSQSADWTQNRHNAARTGFNPGETILSPENVSELAVKWAMDPTAATSSNTFAVPGPAVIGDIVYMGANVGGPEAGNGELFARRTATGEELWRVSDMGFITGAPAVGNGLIHIGDFAGAAHAYDISYGTKVWTGNVYGIVDGSPLLFEGLLYYGNSDGDVTALDPATGAEVWHKVFSAGSSVSPSGAGGIVYVNMGEAGTTYALHAATGDEVWAARPGTEPLATATPIVINGAVFTADATGVVRALDACTGELKWMSPARTGDGPTPTPAVANGVVYVVTGTNVHALSTENGDLLWSHPVGAASLSQPAVANGVVYFGDVVGNTYALSAADGTQLWSYRFPTPLVDMPPTVAHGTLYFGTDGGNIAAFGLP